MENSLSRLHRNELKDFQKLKKKVLRAEVSGKENLMFKDWMGSFSEPSVPGSIQAHIGYIIAQQGHFWGDTSCGSYPNRCLLSLQTLRDSASNLTGTSVQKKNNLPHSTIWTQNVGSTRSRIHICFIYGQTWRDHRFLTNTEWVKKQKKHDTLF